MIILYVMCVCLAARTAVFWVVEFQPIVKAWKEVNPGIFSFIFYIIAFFKAGVPFLLDMVCTIATVSVFSLSGVLGTAMGFIISNVISIAILCNRKKEKKAVLA